MITDFIKRVFRRQKKHGIMPTPSPPLHPGCRCVVEIPGMIETIEKIENMTFLQKLKWRWSLLKRKRQ